MTIFELSVQEHCVKEMEKSHCIQPERKMGEIETENALTCMHPHSIYDTLSFIIAEQPSQLCLWLTIFSISSFCVCVSRQRLAVAVLFCVGIEIVEQTT